MKVSRMYEVEDVRNIRHEYLTAIDWNDGCIRVKVQVSMNGFIAESYIDGFIVEWDYGTTIHAALTSLYILLQRFYKEPDKLKKVLPIKLGKSYEEVLQDLASQRASSLDLIAFVLRAAQAMELEEIKGTSYS